MLADVLALAARAAHADAFYTITNLGTREAIALNNLGDVVGNDAGSFLLTPASETAARRAAGPRADYAGILRTGSRGCGATSGLASTLSLEDATSVWTLF